MSHSIRGRLIASYVLLTLFTAAVIGFLAIWLIDRYVERQEDDSLYANAEAIAAQSLGFVRPFVMRPALQHLARSASFFGNVQVRILDAKRDVLVDSGAWFDAQDVTWVIESARPGDEGEAPDVVYFRAAPMDAVAAVIGPAPGEPVPMVAAVDDVIVMQRSPSVWGDRLSFEPAMVAGMRLGMAPAMPGSGMAPHMTMTRTVISQTDEISTGADSEVQVWGRVLVTGTHVSLLAESVSARQLGEVEVRSATVPIYDGGQVAGYVELRRMGSYAEESLPAIRQAFVVAAGGALLVASVIGLVVSRGLTAPVQSLADAAARMRAGDLTARAPVHSRDELGALAEQFNLMAERLQGSFRELAAERDTLRRFVADASHELRTPITALRTFHELLQGSAQRDAEARAEFLAESIRQIDRLEWITRNLLDLSRLDAGLTALDLQPHDAGDLLRASIAPFAALAKERDITLDVEVEVREESAGDAAENAPKLICDGPRVERALCNLLDNALKFTPRGGRVWARVRRDGEQVIFEIEDTGAGIEPDELPHIFERFHRGRHSDLPGSGLGLAIVQSVAQAHGGTVEAQSEVGVGSRFVLRLPNVRT